MMKAVHTVCNARVSNFYSKVWIGKWKSAGQMGCMLLTIFIHAFPFVAGSLGLHLTAFERNSYLIFFSLHMIYGFSLWFGGAYWVA